MKPIKLISTLVALLIVVLSCHNPDKIVHVFGKVKEDSSTTIQLPLSHDTIYFSTDDAKRLNIDISDVRGFYHESSGTLFLLEAVDGFKVNGYYIIIIERSGNFKKA